jgi:putative heme-binding domain-containing protein
LLESVQERGSIEAALARVLKAQDSVVPPTRKLTALDLLSMSHAGNWSQQLREALTDALTHPHMELRLKAVQTVAAAGSDAWDAKLRAMAADPDEDPAVRTDALAVVVRRSPELDATSTALLSSRLAPSNSPLARVRAAETVALARPKSVLVQALLIAAESDPSISPNHVLAAALRGELSAGMWAPLLRYLTASIERGWAITRTELEPLLESIPPSAQAQADAAKLASAIRGQSEQQQALLRRYEPLLARGDAARGRQVFFGKASCASCHRVGREGQDVGPDLTRLGAIRAGRDILESVLLPSATFAQGYDTYLVQLKDGDSIAGGLRRETPEAILLRTASGAELRLARQDVVSLARSRLSMMPDGLLHILTDDEAADLLAFLQDLK